MLERNSLKRIFLFIIMGYLCSGILLTALVSLPLFATYFQRYLVSVFVLGAEIFSSLALGHFILPKLMQRFKLKFSFLAYFLAFGCGLMAVHVGPFDLFAGLVCTFLPISYLCRLHFARQTPWMLDQQYSMLWFSVWLITPIAVVVPILLNSLEGVFVSKIIFGQFAVGALSLLLLNKYGNELMFNENSVYDVDPEIFRIFQKREQDEQEEKDQKNQDKSNQDTLLQDQNEPNHNAPQGVKRTYPWGLDEVNNKDNSTLASSKQAHDHAPQTAFASDIWQDHENIKPITNDFNGNRNDGQEHDDWGLNAPDGTNQALTRGNFVETNEAPFNPFEVNQALGQAINGLDSEHDANQKSIQRATSITQAEPFSGKGTDEARLAHENSHLDYLEGNSFEQEPINKQYDTSRSEPSLDSPFGDGENPNAQGALDNSITSSQNPFEHTQNPLDSNGGNEFDQAGQIDPFAIDPNALPEEINTHNAWLNPHRQSYDMQDRVMPQDLEQNQTDLEYGTSEEANYNHSQRMDASSEPTNNLWQKEGEWHDQDRQAQGHFNSMPHDTLRQRGLMPVQDMAINGQMIGQHQNPLEHTATTQEVQDLIDAVPATQDPLSFTHLADRSNSPAFDLPLQQSNSYQHPNTLMELENGNVPEWMHPNVSGGDGHVYSTTNLLPGNMLQRPSPTLDNEQASSDPWAITNGEGTSMGQGMGQDLPAARAGARNPIDFLKAQVLGQSVLDPVSAENKAKAPRRTLSQPELMSYTNLEIAEPQPKMAYTSLDIEQRQAPMNYTQLEKNSPYHQGQQENFIPNNVAPHSNNFEFERSSQGPHSSQNNYQGEQPALNAIDTWGIDTNMLQNRTHNNEVPYSGQGGMDFYQQQQTDMPYGDNRTPQYTNLQRGEGAAPNQYTNLEYGNNVANQELPRQSLSERSGTGLNYTNVEYGAKANPQTEPFLEGRNLSGTVPTYTDVEYGDRAAPNRNGQFNNLYQGGGGHEHNYTDVEYGDRVNPQTEPFPAGGNFSGTAPTYTDVEYGARQAHNRNAQSNNLYQGDGEPKHNYTNVEYGASRVGQANRAQGFSVNNHNGRNLTYTNLEYGIPQPKQNRNAQFNNLYNDQGASQSYSYTASNYGVVNNRRTDNQGNIQYSQDPRGIRAQRGLGSSGKNGNRKLNYTNLEIATPQQRSNNRVTIGAQDFRDKKLAQIKEDQLRTRGTQQTQSRNISDKEYNFGPERLSTKANHTVEIVSNGQVVAKVQGNNKSPISLGPKTQTPKPQPKQDDDEFEQELIEKLRYLRKKRAAGRNSIFIN